MKQLAKEFAYGKHADQVRKGSGKPFITHLNRVNEILVKLTDDEELIATGWLHDTVEDTDTTLMEIEEKFGRTVAHYVDLESERKIEGDSSVTWYNRKREQLERLSKVEDHTDVFIVTFADKLANLMEMFSDWMVEGSGIWKHFNASKVDHKWYYQSFLNLITEKVEIPEEFVKLYETIMNVIFV